MNDTDVVDRAGAEPRPAALRVLLPIGLALVAALIVIAVSTPIDESDTWQHLRVGQAIWGLRTLPRANVWSWPTYGAPYDLPSWLFCVLMWPFYSVLGVAGLFAWRWVTALAVAALIFTAARRAARGMPGAGGMATLAALLWGALLWRLRWQVRPETLVAVLLAAELLLLESRRRRRDPPPLARDPAWLLIPLQILWINVHLSYYLGLVIAGGYMLDEAWRGARGESDRAAPLRLLLVITTAAAACLLNPFGIRSVVQPFHFFLFERGEPIYRMIDELHPIVWSQHAEDGLVIYLALTIVLAIASWRRRGFDPAQAVVLVVLLPQALATKRFLMLFAIANTPFLARDAEWALSGLAARLRRAPAMIGASALALVTGLAAVAIARSNPPLGEAVHRSRLPIGACDFIASHGVRGRSYSMFWNGGYLLWRFWPDPGRLPFMDIHQSGTRIERDLQAFSLTDSSAWAALRRRYRFDWILLPTRESSVQGLLGATASDPEWALVFADDGGSLLVRRGGSATSLADSFAYRTLRLDNHATPALMRLVLGDSTLRRSIEPELDRAVASSRWNARALGLRAQCAVAEGRWPAAIHDLEAALAVDPRLPGGEGRLAYALVMGGEPEQALAAIGRARRRGSPESELEPIAKLAQSLMESRKQGGRKQAGRP